MGLRLIWMRPLLRVVLVPSIPMNDDTLSTAGSRNSTRTRACCRSAIAGNEIDCGPSDIPWMMPVSWIGKNPFGAIAYSATVSASVAAATRSVSVWCSSTQRSVRP